MYPISVTVKDWAAWAPGIESRAQWQQWARGELEPEVGAAPQVSAIPAILRRRLSSLGKWRCRWPIRC